MNTDTVELVGLRSGSGRGTSGSGGRRNNNKESGGVMSTTTFCCLLGVTVLLFMFFWGTSPSSNEVAEDTKSGSSSIPSSLQYGTTSHDIVSGTVKNIDYYHCSGISTPANPKIYDLVLLHGSAFTKEDWKTSGILQDLCSYDHVRVTALDLSVAAKYDELLIVLDELAIHNRITLPIDSIVTPSASGSTIVDWVLNDPTFAISSRNQYIQSWIPVASFAVLTAVPNEVVLGSKLNNWPIMAIYGDRDIKGRRVADVLEQINTANTKVVKLVGGHPCYLDSPKEFVAVVYDFLLENKK